MSNTYGDSAESIQAKANKLKRLVTPNQVLAIIELARIRADALQGHAVNTLGFLKDTRAIEPMIALLQESGDKPPVCIFWALLALSENRSVPALAGCIDPLARFILPYREKSEGSEQGLRNLSYEILERIVGDDVFDWCKSQTELHTLCNCECSACGETVHRWRAGKCSGCGMIRRHYSDFTDLHMAIRREEPDLETIRALCRNGLTNVGDEENFTPLMKACGPKGTLEIVKLLIEEGANIHASSRRGTTALSMAALHGNYYIEEYLTSKGAVCDFVVRNR